MAGQGIAKGTLLPRPLHIYVSGWCSSSSGRQGRPALAAAHAPVASGGCGLAAGGWFTPSVCFPHAHLGA